MCVSAPPVDVRMSKHACSMRSSVIVLVRGNSKRVVYTVLIQEDVCYGEIEVKSVLGWPDA